MSEGRTQQQRKPLETMARTKNFQSNSMTNYYIVFNYGLISRKSPKNKNSIRFMPIARERRATRKKYLSWTWFLNWWCLGALNWPSFQVLCVRYSYLCLAWMGIGLAERAADELTHSGQTKTCAFVVHIPNVFRSNRMEGAVKKR